MTALLATVGDLAFGIVAAVAIYGLVYVVAEGIIRLSATYRKDNRHE